MTDGVFPDRLNQLRTRWEADPASRIFLQLAEEYRHLGRVQEALAVLDKGLSEHPGYLSALVAKGRCHLELADGDAARVVLERVVKQDATQMVANKLLVRAYLETGDPAKARERLDLYSLLNDSDPEIEELRRRIRLLEKPVRQEVPSMDVPPPAAPAPEPADVFDLGLPPMPPPAAEAEDLFAALPAAFPRMGLPATATPAPTPVEAQPTEDDADLIFPGLGAGDSRRRYLAALEADGLFAFEPAAAVVVPVEEVAPPPVRVSEEAAWLDEAAAATPSTAAPVLAPLSPAIFEPEPFEAPAPAVSSAEELWAEEVEAAPAPAEPAVEILPEPVVELEAQPVVELPRETVVEAEPEAVPEVEAAPVVELEVEQPPVAEPEPGPAPIAGPEPAARLGVEAITATATLGELYFLQGYYSEAERIFREVLGHEPGNLVALTGLERLAALGPQPTKAALDARRLLSGYRRDASWPADVELRARKAYLLNRYLERLREGSPLDVS